MTKGMSKKMLTRLAPRGTSNANFIKNIRTKPVNSARSLRGRDVSVSTDEEEEEEEEEKEKHANSSKVRKSAKPPQGVPKEKGKSSAQGGVSGAKLKRTRSGATDDASEDSEKDASGRTNGKQQQQRPSRKTKEAATVYLNVIGRKLKGSGSGNDARTGLAINSFF